MYPFFIFNNIFNFNQTIKKEVFELEQLEVVEIKRGNEAESTSYILNSGQEINYQEALDMARNGQIKSVDQIQKNEPDHIEQK